MGKVIPIILMMLFWLIPSSWVFAQTIPSKLIDSLAAETNDNQIIELSLDIASELKYKDKLRTFHYINLAEKKARKINTDSVWMNFYKRASNIYGEMDALDLSLKYLLKEYDYYKNTQDPERYIIENKLGVLNGRLNSPEKALSYFKGIVAPFKMKKNVFLLSKTYNNIGLAYLSLKKPDSSFFYFQKGLELLPQSSEEKLEIYLRTNIGRSYAFLGRKRQAKESFQKAIRMITDTVDKNVSSWVNRIYAQFFLDNHSPDSAVVYAKKAKSLEPSHNSFGYVGDLKVLYQAYEQKKDYKRSTHFYRHYDQARDSLNIEEKAVNAERLKIEYAYQVKKQREEIQDNRKKIKYLIIIGGLVILLLVLGMILYRYKNRLTKIKLADELKKAKENELELNLELKNKELVSETLKTAEQSEMLSAIQEELKKIKRAGLNAKATKTISRLQSKISSNAPQNNWEEFEWRFTKVYESFYQKLKEVHPHLSVHDKRLCALLRLNFSTKEIASITKISVKSVENSRTRLRKKLGLTNQKIELSAYLSEL